jgi:hypothetical protein
MNELILFDEIFGKTFIIVMLAVVLSLVLIFIMHILMPKKVLETYFKEPYFRPAEITMFTGFPFGYMRTAMFNRVLGFPASGKKRGLENAYKLAPVWYCKASKYLILFVIPLIALMLLLTTIGFIRYELWK